MFLVNLAVELADTFKAIALFGGIGVASGFISGRIERRSDGPINRTAAAESLDYRLLKHYTEAVDAGNSWRQSPTTLAESRGKVVVLRKHFPLQHPAGQAGDPA